jgi:hypothetical protein
MEAEVEVEAEVEAGEDAEADLAALLRTMPFERVDDEVAAVSVFEARSSSESDADIENDSIRCWLFEARRRACGLTTTSA